MDHIWGRDWHLTPKLTLQCLHCAHRSLCFWDLNYDTNRQQQAWRLRPMVSQEAIQRPLDWQCDKCRNSTSHLTRAPELSRYQASPWLVRSCRETGPAVRHITSAPCQDTARLETSEGQTTLNMGLHGRERPLSSQLRNFHCPEEGGRQSKLERRSSVRWRSLSRSMQTRERERERERESGIGMGQRGFVGFSAYFSHFQM